jgi:hypothetical protein
MSQADRAFYTGMMFYDQNRRNEALLLFQAAFHEYQKNRNFEGQARSLVMAGETLRMLNQVEEGGTLLKQAAEIAEQQLTSAEAFTFMAVT